MNTTVSSFLMKHNFVNHIDVLALAQGILDDMRRGLKKQPSDQDMIRTFCNPPKDTAKNQSVIVIDAGGTNFRSCLVTFDAAGIPTISEMEKTKMPGVEKELSRKDFFEQIAVNLEHLKNKSDRIGFCFSYPMEIQKDGDGILLGFSKEVKAPEVIGSKVGECLKAALAEHGWNTIKRVTMCNDTTSALLAGAATAGDIHRYSSYIGYILGTGMNAAYLQPDTRHCEERSDVAIQIDEQIIVCESGKYKNINRSDFDIEFDKTTVKPGSFYMEKQCSGAYLGPVSTIILQNAAKEGLFSQKMNEELLKLEPLTLIEMDKFLHGPFNKDCALGKLACEIATEEDCDMLYQLLDAVVERSARCSAAILTACVIQTGEGKNAAHPICILCNGTTFYKTWMVNNRVHAYLDEILTNKLGIYWEIVSAENDITLGTAISGLIE
ncbi:MAG: hexokinase [Treponema sp.]|nr:hexokinase [Treponema sp.]